MESSSTDSSVSPVLSLTMTQVWKYETDEFHGICEIAKDAMVIKCVFATTTRAFYDVLEIDRTIRSLLENPVSVERMAEQLADIFPDLAVTVMGRAATHGWITSAVPKRWDTRG